MLTLSRIIIAFCIAQFTFTTLNFLEMFHVISLAPLAPFYAFTNYLGAQYERVEYPLMPLLYPLFWCLMLKLYIHIGSKSKPVSYSPMIVILGCVAQQALLLYAIVFWGRWGKDWEEIDWVFVARDSVASVLTNLGLVATLKGWQWDGGYMDSWFAKMDAWDQSDRDARIKESLGKTGLEFKLESGLKEKSRQDEVVKI